MPIIQSLHLNKRKTEADNSSESKRKKMINRFSDISNPKYKVPFKYDEFKRVLNHTNALVHVHYCLKFTFQNKKYEYFIRCYVELPDKLERFDKYLKFIGKSPSGLTVDNFSFKNVPIGLDSNKEIIQKVDVTKKIDKDLQSEEQSTADVNDRSKESIPKQTEKVLKTIDEKIGNKNTIQNLNVLAEPSTSSTLTLYERTESSKILDDSKESIKDSSSLVTSSEISESENVSHLDKSFNASIVKNEFSKITEDSKKKTKKSTSKEIHAVETINTETEIIEPENESLLKSKNETEEKKNVQDLRYQQIRNGILELENKLRAKNTECKKLVEEKQSIENLLKAEIKENNYLQEKIRKLEAEVKSKNDANEELKLSHQKHASNLMDLHETEVIIKNLKKENFEAQTEKNNNNTESVDESEMYMLLEPELNKVKTSLNTMYKCLENIKRKSN